jgi:hypothetical protein
MFDKTMHDINAIKQSAKDILAERGISPNTKGAYDVWFRHFDSDITEVLAHYSEHGDILPWLYDTAELYIDPDFIGSDKGGRASARELVRQFSN